MPHPRRAHVAVNPRARLVNLYLRCYATDPAFGEALEAFYQQHRSSLAEIARMGVTLTSGHLYNGSPGASNKVQGFLRALRAPYEGAYTADGYDPDKGGFAERWQLHQLSVEGLDTLCGWLRYREYRERVGNIVVTEHGEGQLLMEHRPEEHLKVTVREHFVRHSIGNEHDDYGVRMSGSLSLPLNMETDEYDRPVLRGRDGSLAGYFDPISETPRDAKRRLRRGSKEDQAFIHAQIDAIAAAYEGEGATMPDTQTELRRHMNWLYRRVVHRESCATISEADAKTSPRGAAPHDVRTVTRTLAETLRVFIPSRFGQ